MAIATVIENVWEQNDQRVDSILDLKTNFLNFLGDTKLLFLRASWTLWSIAAQFYEVIIEMPRIVAEK